MCTIPKALGVCSQDSLSRVPRLKKIWADAASRGQDLAEGCHAPGEWELEVVERAPGTRGLSMVPRRWVVERTFSWITRSRSMSKDDEREVQSSETLIQVAMLRLLLAGLGCTN
jgi:putative transposase